MLHALQLLFRAHETGFWSLIGSYISGGLIATALDSYCYSSQPKYRNWLMHWWYPLSNFTSRNANRMMVERLGEVDRFVFGSRLLSFRAIATGLGIAALVQASFFGSTINVSDFAKLANTVLAFIIFVGIPFIIALIVTRLCVRHAASRKNLPSTMASASALMLFLISATALLMTATAFIYFGIMVAAEHDHLTDYEIVDLFALEGVLAVAFILTTFEITFVPAFCYLGIAAFTILLVILVNVLRGSLEREIEDNVRKIWQFAFRTAWVLGGILLVAAFFAYSAILAGFDLGRRVIPYHLGSIMATEYLENLPVKERPKAALRLRHYAAVTDTADPNRLFPNSTTGLYVIARMVTGDLSVKVDPVKQYFDQTNSCWMSENYDQLKQMIEDRLAADPHDIWALYQEACFYTFADHKPQLASTFAAAFIREVDASQANKDVKDKAHKLHANVLTLARIPDISVYFSQSRIHEMLRYFPGNEQGRDIWLACQH